jgi:hypothetical protein
MQHNLQKIACIVFLLQSYRFKHGIYFLTWISVFSSCRLQERQELAERVMITRLHLYGKWIKVNTAH